MSFETAEARREAGSAETAWKQHRRECIDCTRATRQRAWDHLCYRGTLLREGYVRASRDLAENRRLDKLPAPGQEALF